MNQDFIVKSWIVERLTFGTKQVMFFTWQCPLCDKKFTYKLKIERAVNIAKRHLAKVHNIDLDCYRDEKIDFASIKKEAATERTK